MRMIFKLGDYFASFVCVWGSPVGVPPLKSSVTTIVWLFVFITLLRLLREN